MTEQPEALRLADCIDPSQIFVSPEMRRQAAAELRRLHELNRELWKALKELKACEAHLHNYVQVVQLCGGAATKSIERLASVRAAITKAEANTQPAQPTVQHLPADDTEGGAT